MGALKKLFSQAFLTVVCAVLVLDLVNASENLGLQTYPIPRTDNRPGPRSDREVIEDTIREINRMALSDTLWHRWRAMQDSQLVIAKVDTINASKNFAKGVSLAREGFNLLNDLNHSQQDSLSVQKIKVRAILLFERARTYFETSFKFNPFDIRTQNYLIWIYQNLAELHSNCNNMIRSITMIEYLTYILHDDPKIYHKLAEKYFTIGNWDKALSNSVASINLMLEDEPNIDKRDLFDCYCLRGNAQLQLNRATDALLSFSYAMIIAPTEQDADETQKMIDWINWDSCNVDASRKWDSLNAKFNTMNGDYSSIHQGYLDLLSKVKTRRAQNDVNWRIAQLEFKFLNQREQALQRMFDIVKQVPLDTTRKALNKPDQNYLNDYGSMCYLMAIDFLRQHQHHKALIYLFQSVGFWWNQVGKSYYQLARLSEYDNQAVINYAQEALIYEEHLTKEERKNLYYLLYSAYKRQGLFEEAKMWFDKMNAETAD
ncbi:MAG: hypothetical protein ONB13_07755 [candidate division KSB1 bacterium]|nr:hypothetical protein [candidate division KSB1 bacterium]MDZ7336244.1 hypothetical protein [candidate division KSB1 bacterium]MDZ7357265.1 hypothetical protein [candidate division KSB1 bacterium]MDZ7376501.1 hypothetical protein [candidate division KSB1 bacterium]MDZ7402107.1 hypothetical protein [candidate division KSB1 bacterium]